MQTTSPACRVQAACTSLHGGQGHGPSLDRQRQCIWRTTRHRMSAAGGVQPTNRIVKRARYLYLWQRLHAGGNVLGGGGMCVGVAVLQSRVHGCMRQRGSSHCSSSSPKPLLEHGTTPLPKQCIAHGLWLQGSPLQPVQHNMGTGGAANFILCSKVSSFARTPPCVKKSITEKEKYSMRSGRPCSLPHSLWIMQGLVLSSAFPILWSLCCHSKFQVQRPVLQPFVAVWQAKLEFWWSAHEMRTTSLYHGETWQQCFKQGLCHWVATGLAVQSAQPKGPLPHGLLTAA